MRYNSKRSKCKKYMSCIRKKSYKLKKSRGAFKSTISPPGVDLEAIDELIQINTCKHIEGRGGWKVLPKDSWELYKKNRKRRPEEKDNGSKATKPVNKKPGRKMPKRNKKTQSRKFSRKPRNCRIFKVSKRKDVDNRGQKRANNLSYNRILKRKVVQKNIYRTQKVKK